jgi:hypothetical protein
LCISTACSACAVGSFVHFTIIEKDPASSCMFTASFVDIPWTFLVLLCCDSTACGACAVGSFLPFSMTEKEAMKLKFILKKVLSLGFIKLWDIIQNTSFSW